MVKVKVFGLQCGTAGDTVILCAELVYQGGAGSKSADAARDWKPDAKLAAAAKAGVGGSSMWKSAFKTTVHTGASNPVAFLQRQKAAMTVLEKHGIADSLMTSWSVDAGTSAAWAGVKMKADPSGLHLKKVVEELRACEIEADGEEADGEEAEEE